MRHKLFYLVLSLLLGFSSVNSAAQVSVSIDGLPLRQALAEVEKQSGYSFFYSSLLPNLDVVVSLEVENASIEKVMDNLVMGLGIEYEIKEDKQIVLTVKTKEKSKSDKFNLIWIEGRVVDSSNIPIPSVGVVIEGTSVGTVTDEDGYFSMEVPSEDCVLEFMCMGFQSLKEKVGSRRQFNLILKEDAEFLDEVVVVGYGTQKKVNLTGSVSMVGSEDISTRPIASVATGLQGLLPGVTVVNPSGQPGESNSTIRVRGVGTIGNANPLILIDGVEGDIATINPESKVGRK